jgi:hypothetical protein
MKKFFILMLSVVMIFAIGCSRASNPTYNKSPYTYETAIKNGDVVDFHRDQYNTEKLEKFMENVQNGIKDKVRITGYTIEGGAIITDLEFDGKIIKYTYDNTRDGFGTPTIEKKKFNANSIYKSDSKYYLKSSPNDILIFNML